MIAIIFRVLLQSVSAVHTVEGVCAREIKEARRLQRREGKIAFMRLSDLSMQVQCVKAQCASVDVVKGRSGLAAAG